MSLVLPSSNKEKVFAALAYLWVLVVIPLALRHKSEFIHFHLRQGVMLFVLELALALFGTVPLLGWLFGKVLMAMAIILCLMGAYNALQGKFWRLPWLADYAEELRF